MQELQEQRERLERLKVCEQEIAALQRRRSELEVAGIELDARLKRMTPARGIDPAQAAEIADALHRKRELQSALTGHLSKAEGQGETARKLEQLKMGRDALVAWLDAPNTAGPQTIVKVAYMAILVVTLVVIWSALFIHPVLLLVLLGLGVVLAFLRSFDQNEAWVRLGARRHFDATDLKSPARWNEDAVRERVAQLEMQIESVEAAAQGPIEPESPEENEQDDLERKEVEFAMAELHLAKLMAGTGLEIGSLDEQVKQWLNRLAESRRARRELEKITGKIKALKAEQEGAQDRLFRFLARQGEAPEAGAADWSSLAAGLERLAQRSKQS